MLLSNKNNYLLEKGRQMKITKVGLIYSCSLLLCLISCEDSSKKTPEELLCESEYSTANILVDISEEVYNNDESVKAYSRYSWTSNETSRILSGNGIPNHEVGTFPNPHNPNTIKEQNVNATFTLCPSLVSDTGVQVGGPAGAIAYAINSVKFDPGTAGRCDDSGTCSLAMGQGRWRIEALGHNTFDFGDDMNHAHVQPTGEYHYHGMPELLLDLLGQEKNMTLVGWASDGFPVYARYGYTDENSDETFEELLEIEIKKEYFTFGSFRSPHKRLLETMSINKINESSNQVTTVTQEYKDVQFIKDIAYKFFKLIEFTTAFP